MVVDAGAVRPASEPLTAEPGVLGVEAARAAIFAALRPIDAGTEVLPLGQAVGRVLGDALVSPIDVPAHDNSAMDGYAFSGAALRPHAETLLRQVGAVLAGESCDAPVQREECVRIMTGAALPQALDTVAPVELCRTEGEWVRIPAGALKAGDNRRTRGEDLARGRLALPAGRVLRPSDIGLAASLGLARLKVRRRLRVAVFSTGNEIASPGGAMPPHGIYDSNRYALIAALQRLGVEPLDLGLVRDDAVALEAALQAATHQADAILTSGGVSVGDVDHTREVIERMGSVSFWKVAMQPGRPFAFGTLRGPDARPVWLFALPGNPVAALVAFYVFARDALLALAGATVSPLPVLRARSRTALRKRPGRTEFQRGRVQQSEDGSWDVQSVGSQGSGILSSMSAANALIVLGHAQESVEAGEWVDVWLFDGLV